MTGRHVALIPHTSGRSAQEALVERIEADTDDLEVLTATTPAESLDGIRRADILITMRLLDDWYDHLDDVAWVQALSSGVNHYDLDRLERDGIALTNVAGIHARPIAQQVIGYMLMFERNLLMAVHQQHRGVWERFSGGELGDRTVGIVGLGAIGSQVASYARTFGIEVVGTKRDADVDLPDVDRVYPPEALPEVLAVADYLVLACPLTDETRGLIDRDAMRILPGDAIVINIARGGVIEESDLANALQSGHLRGAALDVFEEEPLPSDSVLWDLSNVVITPHMAGSTPHYWERCVDVFLEHYDRYRRGELDAMANRVI